MDPVVIIFLSCLGIGAVVGLLAGMLGIGGGLIIVPMLSYLLINVLGMSTQYVMQVAVATSLSTIIFTGLSSALTHHKLGNFHKPTVAYTSIGIGFGAIAGAFTASAIPGETLTSVFAVLVMLIALQMVFGKKRASANHATPVILGTIGSATGAVSAFMGIGGGALLVPALVWFKVNIRQAIGCAAFCGLVIAIFGTVSFVISGWSNPSLPSGSVGYVYLPASAGIIATSMLTANIGAKLGQKVNVRVLKLMLAVLLIVVSVKMLVGIE